MLTVIAVPAFRDNYIWLICRGGFAVAVDPGDAGPVESALLHHGLKLAAIVLTHHHHDHTGGVAALVSVRPGLRVYGPRGEPIAHLTNRVSEGDKIYLDAIELELSIIDVPGHTNGHISYFGAGHASAGRQPLLFCGDTLFCAGCGRLFEGTARQMQESLAKLAALPGETLVYCGHEYTVANLEFALAVEPDNRAIHARMASARTLRTQARPTVPSTMDLELETNPFLRWDVSAVRAAADAVQAGAGDSQVATFAAIRAWKDRFRPGP
jgi:hydroxyacylglutathione hydrolase